MSSMPPSRAKKINSNRSFVRLVKMVKFAQCHINWTSNHRHLMYQMNEHFRLDDRKEGAREKFRVEG